TVTMRTIPAARAEATTSDSGRVIMSRWVWLSRAGRGSGAGCAGAVTMARSADKESSGAEPGQFLVHHRRVQLGEQRLGRGQRGAGPQRNRGPARRAVVRPGDHRVGRAARLVALFHPRHVRPGTGAAQQLVDLLRGA